MSIFRMLRKDGLCLQLIDTWAAVLDRSAPYEEIEITMIAARAERAQEES